MTTVTPWAVMLLWHFGGIMVEVFAKKMFRENVTGVYVNRLGERSWGNFLGDFHGCLVWVWVLGSHARIQVYTCSGCDY